MINVLKMSCVGFLISIWFIGCTAVHEVDREIQVHWIEQNETAPFSGILLNEHTYYRLREELNKCKYGQ